MRALRAAVFTILFTASALLAQSAEHKAVKADSSFDLIKSLVGNWEGKSMMGEAVSVSYRLTAGGSALLSEIQGQMGGEPKIWPA